MVGGKRRLHQLREERGPLAHTHQNPLILAQEPQRSEPLCTLISGPPLSVPLALPADPQHAPRARAPRPVPATHLRLRRRER